MGGKCLLQVESYVRMCEKTDGLTIYFEASEEIKDTIVLLAVILACELIPQYFGQMLRFEGSGEDFLEDFDVDQWKASGDWKKEPSVRFLVYERDPSRVSIATAMRMGLAKKRCVPISLDFGQTILELLDLAVVSWRPILLDFG